MASVTLCTCRLGYCQAHYPSHLRRNLAAALVLAVTAAGITAGVLQ